MAGTVSAAATFALLWAKTHIDPVVRRHSFFV